MSQSKLSQAVCATCGSTTVDDTCLNADCSTAADIATADAARDTAKSTGIFAEPRAFTITGAVD